MRFSLILVFLSAAFSAASQLVTVTTTVQTPFTATGATVLATGATVTFPIKLTTFTASVGRGTTVILGPNLSETSIITTSTSATTRASASQLPCQVYADGDIIGLGVRLGLYFQLFSNIVVLWGAPDEALVSITTSS